MSILLVILASGWARGQSAIDGFDPEADFPILVTAIQGDGKLIIGGDFGNVAGVPRSCIGRLNPDGSLDGGFDPGASARVRALAVQPDGAIIVAGDFIRLGGGGVATMARAQIGRLLPNGDLDPNFNPGTDGNVYCLLLQPDGKIVVGGGFSTMAGSSCNNIGRLNPDGSIDSSFSGIGTDTTVHSLALQPDGKIVLGGEFSLLGDQPFNYVGRLETNGTPDMTFTNLSLDGFVSTIALDAGGNILLGGQFSNLGGAPHNYVARLKPNGTPDSSFIDPGADGYIDSIAFQSDGKILLGGEFVNLGGQPQSYLGRLNSDGSLDTGFSPSVNGNVYSVLAQPDGKIAVGGQFTLADGQTRSYIARFYADSSLDATLNAGLAGGNGVTGAYGFALQPDGKILLAGNFSSLGGITRSNIGRLFPDGSLDSFNPGANGVVRCVAIQTDGEILVGGNFTSLSREPHANLGRLYADGSADSAFKPAASGASQTIYALALQSDGKILVGGDFTSLDWQGLSGLGRLNSDGTLDGSFNPTLDGPVYTIALQPDGGIIAGGSFHTLDGSTQVGLGRVKADGSLDGSFNPVLLNSLGAVTVQALALEADGTILVGGNFTRVNGQNCTNLCHLLANGTLDSAFHPGVNGPPYTLAVQTDGKILVGGWFNILAGQLRNRIGRLNSDGTLDGSFDLSVGANNFVYSLMLQPDGEILAGGLFSALLGQSRNGIGRIAGGGAASQSLEMAAQGGAWTWTRGGAGPELQQATLEQSVDGTHYTLAGSGTRISGGWQFTNASMPAAGSFFVRARGRCGDGAGSTGLIENVYQCFNAPVLAPPVLTAAPFGPAFSFSFSSVSGASFSVLASTNPALPMANWTLLGAALELSPGQFQFSDPQAPSFPARFYKVRSP